MLSDPELTRHGYELWMRTRTLMIYSSAPLQLSGGGKKAEEQNSPLWILYGIGEFFWASIREIAHGKLSNAAEKLGALNRITLLYLICKFVYLRLEEVDKNNFVV
ncbi:hypothetical protein PoB_006889000 [Plakobranchus ocellatus]|uniref:Uncharacterized protein n=1 Tax=Plakobranchus ocellatus TaxID=259542 RepID=A0AAV4DE59_9GAST|nr:hypothetical protein PoB_006889000 [Plakobranchus ocellatus]